MELDEAVDRYKEVIIYENTDLESAIKKYIKEKVMLPELPFIVRNNIDLKKMKEELKSLGTFGERGGDCFHFSR